MSALRDLVMGTGCGPDAGQLSNNPLSALFSGLLDSTRKHEHLAETRMPEVHLTGQDRDKIASRTGVVTRHLFPDASKEFLDEQVRNCLESLDSGAGPSWQDGQRYESFRQPTGVPLAQHAGPSSSMQWAADFQHRQMPHAPPSAWAQEFQHRQMPHASSSAWADEYQEPGRSRWPQGPASRSPWGSGRALPSLWADEFTQQQSNPEASTGTAWGDDFAKTSLPGQQLAQEYGATAAQADTPKHTPEQLKAMKGPSADDPLEDPTAASWVRQFNEELAAPSSNAAEHDIALLEAGCQLAPAADNPYSEHPLPLQAAQQMEGRGRLGGAALAYEAAARAAPGNRDIWWRLGRCRLDLGEHKAAVGPLLHTLRGWPTHPGAAPVWRALMQACLGAGKRDLAFDVLSRWLAWRHGDVDAAAGIGGGGTMGSSKLQEQLRALAVQQPEETAMCWEMLGFLHTLRGDPDAAAIAFGDAARATGGRDAATLCLLGSALSQRRAHADAERAFGAAVRRAAGAEGMRAWTGMGRCQAAQGKFEEAVQSYSRALELLPDSASLWDSLALALTAQGRLDVADAAAKHDVGILQQTLIRA